MDNIFFSVDLGTLRDPSAITILARGMRAITGDSELGPNGLAARIRGATEFQSFYRMRYMDRLPLGMDYPTQVTKIKGMLQHPDLLGKTTLLVDATGVGLPVLQMMMDQGLNPIGIWVTAGNTVNRRKLGYNVPKRILVSSLNLIYQSRRLKIPYGLKCRKDYIRELEGFKITFTESRTETYEAEQAKIHDDLVMSSAQGIWYAEKHYGSTYKPLSSRKGVVEMKNPLEEGL